MPREYLSPAEQELLEQLPENEAAVARFLMDELDARLVEEPTRTDYHEQIFARRYEGPRMPRDYQPAPVSDDGDRQQGLF